VLEFLCDGARGEFKHTAAGWEALVHQRGTDIHIHAPFPQLLMDGRLVTRDGNVLLADGSVVRGDGTVLRPGLRGSSFFFPTSAPPSDVIGPLPSRQLSPPSFLFTFLFGPQIQFFVTGKVAPPPLSALLLPNKPGLAPMAPALPQEPFLPSGRIHPSDYTPPWKIYHQVCDWSCVIAEVGVMVLQLS